MANENGTAPDIRVQPGYSGEPEEVDVTEYKLEVICSNKGCKIKRYIKPQDAFQVTMCKPCTSERQRAQRAAKRRSKRATMSNMSAKLKKMAHIKPVKTTGGGSKAAS